MNNKECQQTDDEKRAFVIRYLLFECAVQILRQFNCLRGV